MLADEQGILITNDMVYVIVELLTVGDLTLWPWRTQKKLADVGEWSSYSHNFTTCVMYMIYMIYMMYVVYIIHGVEREDLALLTSGAYRPSL